MFLSNLTTVCFFGVVLAVSGNHNNFRRLILTPLKPEIAPCSDFYEYACGNWNKLYITNLTNNPLTVDSFQIVKQKLNDILIESLSSNISTRSEYQQASWQNAKEFYFSCLSSQSEDAISALNHTLNDIGIFPIVNQRWDPESFDWLKIVATLRLYGIKAILQESVGPDWRNSSIPIIYFVVPTFELITKEDLLHESRNSEENLFFYERYIKLLMLKLGLRIRKAKEIAANIVAFEKNLAEIIPKEADIEPPQPMSIEVLKFKIPELDWEKYLLNVLEQDISLSALQVIVDEKYYKSLNSLIQQTNRQTIAEYLLFRFMSKFKVATNNEHNPKSCLESTVKSIKDFGDVFIRQYLSKEKKMLALQVLGDIKNAFAEILNGSDRLDSATRERAMEKLRTTITIVGCNERKENNSISGNYLNLTADYYTNWLNLLKLDTQNEHAQLRTGLLRSWQPNPLELNAFYKVTRNTIFIPAALLLPPIFDISYPTFHHYAVLGAIVGHELTHGFDFEGRNYNSLGAIENWWSTKSLIEYYTSIDCMLSQYRNISASRDKGASHDEFGSISENFADLNGVRLAYKAYMDRKKQSPATTVLEKEVTDINIAAGLSSEQLFFVSFAQFWCSANGNDSAGYGLHSSNKYRVINSLSNLVPFTEAYKCTQDVPMNPTRKCNFF